MIRHPLRAVCLLAIALSLAACESKLTQENYAKVVEGMTISDVEGILGDGEEQDSGGYGIGSSGLIDHSSSRQSSQRVFVWDDGTVQIIITFTDGKLTSKRQTGLQ